MVAEPLFGDAAIMLLPRRDASRCRIVGAFALLVACVTPRAGAQSSPERTPWGLFSARYDTHTSDFIYALYGYGRSFAMVGTLQNPRSGWTELVGAFGHTFTFGDWPSHA